MKIDAHVIMWIGSALRKQNVWDLGLVKMIMPGLQQGSALSRVLYNVYTEGITSNQLE